MLFFCIWIELYTCKIIPKFEDDIAITCNIALCINIYIFLSQFNWLTNNLNYIVVCLYHNCSCTIYKLCKAHLNMLLWKMRYINSLLLLLQLSPAGETDSKPILDLPKDYISTHGKSTGLWKANYQAFDSAQTTGSYITK